MGREWWPGVSTGALNEGGHSIHNLALADSYRCGGEGQPNMRALSAHVQVSARHHQEEGAEVHFHCAKMHSYNKYMQEWGVVGQEAVSKGSCLRG